MKSNHQDCSKVELTEETRSSNGGAGLGELLRDE